MYTISVPRIVNSQRVRTVHDLLEVRIRGMSPGVPLPSMPELRRELSVSQATIERAYDQLEACGLIERKKRKGVYVADRMQTGEFAIVMRPALLGLGASPYYRNVSSHLIQFLHEGGPQWRVHMHLGRQTQTPEQYPSTLDLLEPDVLPQLRGVFSFHELPEMGDALERAQVPVVYIGSAENSPSVGYDDHTDFLRKALGHLREAGCSTVGMINVGHPNDGRLVRAFREAVPRAGLVTRPQWLAEEDANASERAGYETFLRFWSNDTRPDGVVVGDDVVANGVLRATLQLGVRLPQDLRLVTFASRGIDFPYHLPVSRVEYDMRDLAQRAVELMMNRLSGEPIPEKQILLPGRIIKGNTT